MNCYAQQLASTLYTDSTSQPPFFIDFINSHSHEKNPPSPQPPKNPFLNASATLTIIKSANPKALNIFAEPHLPCKNKPFYGVMAANSRSLRDGKHLEVLGYDNPLPGQPRGKRIGLNFERVKYWLSVGAQPSEPVQRILFRAGVLPPPSIVAMGRKGRPRDIRPVDLMTGRVLNVEKLGTANKQKGAEDEPADGANSA
ncbi:30S ribosomal protein S16-2, chloroplastic/mitochondrial-like [Durio zibethinus]|uniref:30S ribosomal protein S16-2, chloroplastic/mitochondrial-like n=1 Tax=Durio zibethinus TaxID=66656 RepID=A0A6P5ZIJ6_DURZI|nr:30S ribosomal protein S16-2, chloroplastic/mitochondrial-like [Durio zibethinus]